MNRLQHGFTMIEMVVVIFLVGAIAAIALPRFALRPSGDSWRTVQDQFEGLLATARQEAISQQRTCRITYTAAPAPKIDQVIAEQEQALQSKANTKKADKDETKKDYGPLSWPLGITSYSLPPTIHLHRLFIDGKQVIDDGMGKAAWIASATGLTQSVVLQMTKKENETTEKMTFWVQAFGGTMSLHDGHVRPDKESPS